MNFENVRLYRECDTGGAHNGGYDNKTSLNIPGLISREIESSAKQASQVKAMQANFGTNVASKIPPLAQMSNQYLDQGQFIIGDDPNGWQWQQPINPLIDPNQYKQYPWDQQKYPQKPYNHDPAFDQEALLAQLAGLKQARKKSAFEELIDGLFTTADKEQVLLDMGYEFENKDNKLIIKRKLSDGTYKVITNSLDDLFLKEITVKFKNLLMAKASLKLKI